MIIINHRVKTISKLKKTPINFGVEIDLRSENKIIYLNHDPFKKGIIFQNWLKKFKHKIIVLNVKEEGLENKILKILSKKKIKKFFFHDQTFSTLLKNMLKTNVSIRYSEYEDLKNKNYLFSKIKWLWLDNFKKIDMDDNFYKYLKRKKVKICLVSPELIKKNRVNEISNLYKYLKKKKFLIDAVCTKKPYLWNNLIKNNLK